MGRHRRLHSWTDWSSLLFPLLALIVAITVFLSENLPGSRAVGVIAALVPWALLAGGITIKPWPFVIAVMIPVAIVSLHGVQGIVFYGLIATVWLGTTNGSRMLSTLTTLASVVLAWTANVVSGHDLRQGALYLPVGALLTYLCGDLMRRERTLVNELSEARSELAARAAGHERTRIAREIHDVVGHSLTVVQLHVAGARRQLVSDPTKVDATLLKAEEIGRESLDHLRRVVGLLRSDDGGSVGAAAPLPTALDVPVLISSARDAGLDVDLDVDGDLAAVEPAVGLAAYRVVQESIANARHHAPGAPVRVSLSVGSGKLDVKVRNAAPVMSANGDDDERDGVGLVGMRERAAACHGDLWAGPADGGWEVRCHLPLSVGRT